MNQTEKIMEVYVQPNASQSEISGLHDGRTKIRLQAPAIDGKANKALIDFLAKHFHVKKNDIEIISGKNSRYKTVRIKTPPCT